MILRQDRKGEFMQNEIDKELNEKSYFVFMNWFFAPFSNSIGREPRDYNRVSIKIFEIVNTAKSAYN